MIGDAPRVTYAHTVSIRHTAGGKWIVCHSWRDTGLTGWRHASRGYNTLAKATKAASDLRASIDAARECGRQAREARVTGDAGNGPARRSSSPDQVKPGNPFEGLQPEDLV